MPNKSQRKQKTKYKAIKITPNHPTRGFKSTHKHKKTILKKRIEKLTNKPALPTPNPDMSKWNELNIPPLLLQALREMDFSCPTPIQCMCIPPAAVSHHVIGAAETGSGKTLAFGLPILIGLLRSSGDIRVEERPEEKDFDDEEMGSGCVAWVDDIPDAEFEQMLANPSLPVPTTDTTASVTRQSLRVLILTPTRELCIQVCSHLRSAAVHTSIQVASLVGGLSVAKQTRMLSKLPEIVVSTPGRYVQLLEEGEKYCQQLSQLSYLVIDEVDRMLTEGHFSNISQIFDRIPCLTGAGSSTGPQVLLFSATVPAQFLNLKNHKRNEPDGVKKLKRYISKKQTDIINLTRKNVLVEKLKEHRLMVESSNKLYYLYYLLKKRGKFLVFSNSISALRQLYGLLTTLSLNILLIHSGMQQKQRLLNLEKFNSSTNSILLASDMASRGIDLKDVSDVIHYHVPNSAQLYVHRCGRTARTSEKGGTSLLLVAPEEARRYNAICRDLNKPAGIPSADITLNQVYRYKEAVQLAIKLNRQENSQRRETKDKSWEKKVSKNIHGEDESSCSEEDTTSLATREDSLVLRGGKERLRNLLGNIDKEESTVRHYRDGLKSVSRYLAAADKANAVTAPYIPLIREKHRRL